ncbi:MAG: hypothetical protein K9H48_12215 [Melioribacteraceae bacterium]|nr:hypothetical protein [Melioribacteraceae bacterium]MCF8395093.1 hypothetical protein [Melioribacteraceae bacterium]MCF8420360.1 hypothetical protein [Melioribacteraceae bacterium]
MFPNNKNNNGYSLPVVLLVVFLITGILFGFIEQIFFSEKLTQLSKSKIELKAGCIENANKFVAKNYHEAVEHNRIDASEILRGLYLNVRSQSRTSFDSLKGNFIYGITPSDYFQNAVTVSRPNARMAVTGSTKITGNIEAARDKIQRGNIFGFGSAAENYLNGVVIKNDSIPMKLFDEDKIKQLFTAFPVNIGSENVLESFLLCDTNFTRYPGKQILSGKTVIKGNLISPNPLEILNIHSTGNTTIEEGANADLFINLYSDSTVTIEKNCYLSNVVIISKNDIIIKTGCRFKNVELYSLKNITTENSHFEYPSVIGIHVDAGDSLNLKNKVSLNSTVVNGSVMLLSSITGIPSNRSMITIDDNSIVHGLIYSENNTELKGKVFGSVYTYNFMFRIEKDEFYLNWLIDTHIDRSKLDNNFLIPHAFNIEKNYRLVNSYFLN